MRFSNEWLIIHEAKQRSKNGFKPTLSGAAEKESELHEQILEHCRNQGWLAFHGSMAHKTFRTPGEPDFIIAASGGRTFYIEAKTSRGKLSTDQLAIQARLNRIGHAYFVVRSFPEFLEVVK